MTDHLPPRPGATGARAPARASSSSSWITSTDHKMIGYLYLITSFVFFLSAA